ncbi:MAG: hypothetical protein LBQ12_07060, partial [Deltaproteobacteria bacterium]|nr:hypothetical protein [Deltaproteobacteria bacterium]
MKRCAEANQPVSNGIDMHIENFTINISAKCGFAICDAVSNTSCRDHGKSDCHSSFPTDYYSNFNSDSNSNSDTNSDSNSNSDTNSDSNS